MTEVIQLDPSIANISTDRVTLTITPWVKAGGLDWGDAAYDAVLAERDRGSLAVAGRLPNRVITVPLAVRTVGSTTFAQFRAQLQAKVGLFQREGGYLSHQVDSSTLYAQVVNATLHLGGSIYQAYRDFDPDVTLTLECIPDWFGPEVDLGDNVETTNPELVFTTGAPEAQTGPPSAGALSWSSRGQLSQLARVGRGCGRG